MVSSTSAASRKSTLRDVTARLLVLGDKQVGKSAAIVRFTTKRFIENYCATTTDWLYKHPLGYDAAKQQFRFVELLEQKDIQLNLSSPRNVDPSQCHSLSSRVALDRTIDEQHYERQQLLNKLHWANAYVIIYAINDSNSFNKAIKYLNFIANEVNDNQKCHLTTTTTTTTSSKANKLLNKLSPETAAGAPAELPASSGRRRPILLLANKSDLDARELRRVSLHDGRTLAMRHQCLFAEISSSRSAKCVERALANLIESISAGELHTSHHDGLAQPMQTQLSYWVGPTLESSNQQDCAIQPPVRGRLVRTWLPLGGTSCTSSQQVVQSSCLAIRAKRPKEADFRLLTPVGASLSTGSSSSNSSSNSTNSSMVHAQGCKPAQFAMTEMPAAASLEPVAGARQPSVSSNSSVSSMGAATQTALNSCGGNNAGKFRNNRYESFKSSFKKASLAIVGSRSLAARVQKTNSSGGSTEESSSAKRSSLGSTAKVQEEEEEVPPAGRAANSVGASDISVASSSSTSSAVTISAASGLTTAQPTRGSWIKSKLSSLGPRESCSANSVGAADSTVEPAPVGRFRRPLFKYKSRRKTVAFEHPAFNKTQSLAGSSQELGDGDALSLCRVSVSGGSGLSVHSSNSTADSDGITPRVSSLQNPLAPVAQRLQRPSSGCSSSSLSGSDPQDSLFVLCPESTGPLTGHHLQAAAIVQQQQIHRVPPITSSCYVAMQAQARSLPAPARGRHITSTAMPARKDSRSTLSRASTSGGSYDEDDECDPLDSELEANDHEVALTPQTIQSSSRLAALVRQQQQQQQHLGAPIKARYQLVRTVQHTLNSLTKSTPATAVEGAQTTAIVRPTGTSRSFCHALSKQDPRLAGQKPCEAVVLRSITAPVAVAAVAPARAPQTALELRQPKPA